MKFSEIYSSSGSPVISFEVFPPKTSRGMDSLRDVLARLVALEPRFMTVTYGAMGTTRSRTVEIASMIHNDLGIECACHLTCVGAPRDQIDGQLEHIHRQGIENIVALRGDPPRGQDSFQAVKGGFSWANELVEHIRSKGLFDIAVGGYPEKHVEAPDLDLDTLDGTNGFRLDGIDAGDDSAEFFLIHDKSDSDLGQQGDHHGNLGD